MSLRRLSFLLACLFLFVAAACRPDAPATPFPAVEPTASPTIIVSAVTLVPTVDLAPTRTATAVPTDTLTPSDTPEPTLTPSATLIPGFEALATNTLPPETTDLPTSGATSLPIPSATIVLTTNPDGTAPPTWTPPPLDPAAVLADHLHFGRPIPDGAQNWVDRTYPYGGTSGGRLQVHHGDDLVNPTGTKIIAAADGTVVYAGDDLTREIGKGTNYYGNLVILQHPFASPEGKPVYTLYGHMNSVAVTQGDVVKKGQVIGYVGATGVAMGPHVHFEVRLGDPFSFDATRNPEMWLFPYRGFGTLAGRVTDASGAPLYQVTLQVKSSSITRNAFTYADDSVHGDDQYHENFTLGDIPANYYDVTVRADNRLRFQKLIYVYPNRITWIDVQLNP